MNSKKSSMIETAEFSGGTSVLDLQPDFLRLVSQFLGSDLSDRKVEARGLGTSARHLFRKQAHMGVGQIKPPGDHRFYSLVPFTRVPFWVPIFDPQPYIYIYISSPPPQRA